MRKVVYAGLGVTSASTGGYVVVYLVRWEWQRALMAGELLLISLVLLVAVAGAHRLGRLEARLSELIEEGRAGGGVGPARLTAVPSPPERVPVGERDVIDLPPPRFRWLDEDDTYRVFIPVLLGAGIVVSGLAALVERAATALGRRDVRGAARSGGRGGAAFGQVRLPVALVPPSGGVLAGAAEPSGPGGAGGGRRARAVAWFAVAALAAGLIIDAMAELTQDRPDGPVAAPVSTLVVEADTRGRTGAASVDPLATRLWEYCRGSTRPYVEGGGAVPLGGRRYAFVVRPALGEHALRRMRGCLEDAVIDRGRFRVVSVQPAAD